MNYQLLNFNLIKSNRLGSDINSKEIAFSIGRSLQTPPYGKKGIFWKTLLILSAHKPQFPKIYKLCLLTLIYFLIPTEKSLAQISFGGTPYSFGSEFRQQKANNPSLKAYKLSKIDLAKVLAEDRLKPNSNRFAKAIPVNFNLENAGEWENLANGDRLWRLKIHSESALALRVLFDKFFLPEGGKFFMYSEDKQYILGAFTHQTNPQGGRLGTGLLYAESIILEYYEPQVVKNQAIISLFRVDHAYKNAKDSKKEKIEKSFGESGDCNVNINCDLGADFQEVKRGVVKIITADTGGSGWCTGSLINTQTQDKTPYILTATHCEDDKGETFIDTWAFIFNFESALCANPANKPSENQIVSGADIVAKFETTDFLLLKTNSSIPDNFNAYFLGWNRSGTNPPKAACVHHPSGDVKKISLDNNPATTTAWSNNQPNSGTNYFRVVWDENTTTEGGSSGAALLDENQRIIGQLRGGDASCIDNTAADWFGKISASWDGNGTPDSRLKDWLDPNNTNATSVNGMEAFRLNNDAVLTSISSVRNECQVSNNQVFTFRAYNKGKNNLSNITLQYELKKSDNTIVGSGNQNIATLTSGQALKVNVNLNLNEPGQTYTLNASLSLQGLADDNPGNNNATAEFKTSLVPITQFPYVESFENGNANWASGGANNEWVIDKPNKTNLKTVGDGQKAWITNTTGIYANEQNSFILSPPFDFSTLISPIIRASLYVDTELNFDGLQFQISTDCGETWERIGTNSSGGQNWYNNRSSSLPFGDYGNFAWSSTRTVWGGVWKTIQHSLEDYAGSPNVRVRFLFRSDVSDGAEGIGVDKIEILNDPTTGIEESILRNLKIYPNPTDNQVNMTWHQETPLINDLKISIINPLGQTIQAVEGQTLLTAEGASFSLQNLPSGVYFIRFEAELGSFTKRIVKK
jgi:hypothetical protein